MAVVLLMVGEQGKLGLQIDQSLDQGLHVSPVVLPVSFAVHLHFVDMFVEDLSRGSVVLIVAIICS